MLSESGTFSKSPSAWGFPPDTYVVSSTPSTGRTSYVTLNDGNSYLDWVSGLGAIILGYRDPKFCEFVTRSVYGGIGFSLLNYLELDTAKKLTRILTDSIPVWNSAHISVRFAKTGTDATTMAVRLARAVTNRDIIVSFGYHGWTSEFISAEPPGYGIPIEYKRDTIRKINFNDFTSVEQAFQRGSVACVILEHPPMEPKEDWYKFLRDTCDRYGSLLIMDEVVTGLRFGHGGASGLYNIKPDLICMGKGMGNGLPISAVVGYKEYMDWFNRVDPVFCSSTHWGETVSLSAANWILSNLTKQEIERIWSMGKRLMDGLNEAGWTTIGHPPRSLTTFKDDYERAYFIHRMKHYGILMNRPNFPNLGHKDEDVDRTVKVATSIREQYTQLSEEQLKEYVEGKLPRVLFRNR